MCVCVGDVPMIFVDDLTMINGRRDQLEGRIQERYGYAKDQARQEVDDWYTAQDW